MQLLCPKGNFSIAECTSCFGSTSVGMSSDKDWCSTLIRALVLNKETRCPQCAAIITDDPNRLTELASKAVVIPLHSENLLGASLSTQSDYDLFFYALLAAFYDVIQTPLLTKYTATHHDNLSALPPLEIFANLVYHKNTELNIRFWDTFHGIFDGLKKGDMPTDIDSMLQAKVEEVENIAQQEHKIATDAPLIISIANGNQLKDQKTLWEHLPKYFSYVIAINPKDTITSLLNADSAMCLKAVIKVPKREREYKFVRNVSNIPGAPGWAPVSFYWEFYVPHDAPYAYFDQLKRFHWFLLPEIDGHERWNRSLCRLIYSLILDVTFLDASQLPLSTIFPEKIHETAFRLGRKVKSRTTEVEACAEMFAAHRPQILAVMAADYEKYIVGPEASKLLGAFFLMSFHFKELPQTRSITDYEPRSSRPMPFKRLMLKVMGRDVERELGAEIANSFLYINSIKRSDSCPWSEGIVIPDDKYFDFYIPLLRSRLGLEPLKAESERFTYVGVKIIADSGLEAFLADLPRARMYYDAKICLIFVLSPTMSDIPSITTIDTEQGPVRVFICTQPEIYARLNLSSEEIANAEKLLYLNDV